MMKKLIKKIKVKLSIYKSRSEIAFRLLKRKNPGITDRKVVFDISEKNEFGRYLVNLIHCFLISNYQVSLILRKSLFEQFGHHWKIICDHQNIKLAFSNSKDSDGIKFTNNMNESGLVNSVHIKPDLFQKNGYEKTSFRFPPLMHPSKYALQNFKTAETIRKVDIQKNRFKLVFAGSLNENHYQDIYWDGVLMPSRVRLVNALEHHFPDEFFMPTTFEEFKNIDQSPICIVNRKFFSLNVTEYFTFFKESHFVFCPPGIRQPFCHNVIEAMYCKAIPLLEYGDRLSPKLIDEVNCIAYSNEQEFLTKVEKILRYPLNDINKMKSSVKEYYLHNLMPTSVIKNFESKISGGIKEIYIASGK